MDEVSQARRRRNSLNAEAGNADRVVIWSLRPELGCALQSEGVAQSE